MDASRQKVERALSSVFALVRLPQVQPVNTGVTEADVAVVDVVTVDDVVVVVGGSGKTDGTIRYAPEYKVASADESTSVPCGLARSKLEIA